MSHIQQELTSLNHAFRRAFIDTLEIESAIANAVRGGEVPVRGRRVRGYALPLSGAFERIERHVGPDTTVDIYLDRITIPNTRVAFGAWHQMNAGILPDRIIVHGGGAGGDFMDVEADQRALETWIRGNAAPRWWREARAGEETAIKEMTVNEKKRTAVLQAITLLGRENLRGMPQKEREAKIISEVGQAHDGLRVTDRYVRGLWKLRNVPNVPNVP